MKSVIINQLINFFKNDRNVLFVCISGSLAEERSEIYLDSDIDICLKVYRNYLYYKYDFKKLFNINLDVLLLDDTSGKEHLLWHFQNRGLILKGKSSYFGWKITPFQFFKKNINKTSDVLSAIRKGKSSYKLISPCEKHTFFGYFVPLGNKKYSLRYIHTLLAHYAYVKSISSNKFCFYYYVKSEMIKYYLSEFENDKFHDLVGWFFNLIIENKRVITIKGADVPMNQLVINCSYLLTLERELLTLCEKI